LALIKTFGFIFC